MSSRSICTSLTSGLASFACHLEHAHRLCCQIPSGVISSASFWNWTRVPKPCLRFNFGCTLWCGPLRPIRIWACSFPPTFPMPLPQPTDSSFRLHRLVPVYICHWIHDEFPFVVDNCWIGWKYILFRHPTTGTLSCSLSGLVLRQRGI